MGDAGGYFCGDCLLGFRDTAPGSGVVACPRCGRAVPGTPGSAGSRRVGGTPSTLPFRETAAAGSAPGRSGTVAGRHPRRIGPYRLEEEIGRGGMGIVYRARPREGGPTVALKRMRDGATASRADRERFLREARLAGHLRHPGVVPVLDAGEDGPELYFVMPLVPGAGLDERLRGGPMPAADAAECIAAVARAVGHAHARGVIHRDLKPANVLIDPEHGPRVTDFGLARPSDPSRRLTETGELFGTPAYMAPELLEGASPTRAADIYALGAILYECLTGTPPHGTGGFLDLTARALRNDPLPPRRFRPELPPAVDAICLTALERRPAARYADAEALATDLERFARGEAVKARPPGPASRAWRRIRRRPALASALAAALPVAAVAVLAVLAVGGRARPEGARAGLTLRVDPPGAVVLLTHRGGRSLDVPRALGTTPLEGAGVPAGDARLRVEAPGRASVTFPLALAVGARAEVTLRLPSAADVPDDMVVVVPPPAGAGDDLPRRPFLVDRCEVTGAAYKRYCEATGARTPRHWKQRGIPAGRPHGSHRSRVR